MRTRRRALCDLSGGVTRREVGLVEGTRRNGAWGVTRGATAEHIIFFFVNGFSFNLVCSVDTPPY
jgi:hypothetical protein